MVYCLNIQLELVLHVRLVLCYMWWFSWIKHSWAVTTDIAVQHHIHYSGYQSHAPSNDFFPISKTTFWWRSIKCIHDNNGERSYRNHYFNVNSQSIRVARSSVTWLVDKQKLRSKTYKIVESAFSFVSLTGNVLKLEMYKQCTTTWDWTKYK